MAEEEKLSTDKISTRLLDSRLQSYLETLMDQVNEEYQPEELTAVLMKAKPEKSWQWDNDLLSILKQWKD